MKNFLGTILLSLLKRSASLSERYSEEHRHSLQMAHDKLVKGKFVLEEKNAETIQELIKHSLSASNWKRGNYVQDFFQGPQLPILVIFTYPLETVFYFQHLIYNVEILSNKTFR